MQEAGLQRFRLLDVAIHSMNVGFRREHAECGLLRRCTAQTTVLRGAVRARKPSNLPLRRVLHTAPCLVLRAVVRGSAGPARPTSAHESIAVPHTGASAGATQGTSAPSAQTLNGTNAELLSG